MRAIRPRTARSALTRLVLVHLILPAVMIGGLHPGLAQEAAPPPAVIVAEVEVKPVSSPATFSGTVEALNEVELMARVQGFLAAVEFDAGDRVDEGDVLFHIETRPYDAAVAAAEARVAQAEAQLQNTQQELRRQERLTEQNVAAEAQLEDARAAALVAEADVAMAEAQLEQALIEQSYTTVTAPFAGEISRAFFSEGALVGPNGGPLARLVRTDPVRVVFSIPNMLLVELRTQEASGEATDPADLDFRLLLGDGVVYAEEGRLEYVANQADPATGTVPVRLIFDNPAPRS